MEYQFKRANKDVLSSGSVEIAPLVASDIENLEPILKQHVRDSETVELLNAFVDSKVFRGGGIGRKLFEAICDTAKSEGKKYMAIHSGPRYKKSWGFYDRVTDKSNGFIQDKYGKGRHAKTWLKIL